MSSHKQSARSFSWGIPLGVICVVIAIIMYFFMERSVPLANLSFFVSNLFLIVGLLLIALVFSNSIKNALGETTSSFLRRVELSELAKDCERIGLAEIDPDCTNYDYGRILSDAHQLIVVLNDGRTWASVHRDRLRRRFADSTKQTTFFLCHPDSPMLQVLARKGSTDVDTIKSRIRQTVTLLEEIKQSSTSLEILGHHLFNPYSLVVGDDSAIMIPYFLSRGGRTTPLFRFRETDDDGYFRYIVEDIERLRMDAKDISNAANNFETEGVVRLRPAK